MDPSRRGFLRTSAAFGLGIAGLGRLAAAAAGGLRPAGPLDALGPLVPDPAGILDLPAGFQHTVISRVGEEMDDGFLVPPRHDGMAAFAGPGGKTILVRNHEMAFGKGGPFGPGNERLGALDPDLAYDLGHGELPCLGGTTTLVFDTEAQRLEGHHFSLAGTLINCAGGPTPWGSWISCEETTMRAGRLLERDHGFVFEVPADHGGLVEPVPIRAMGRFVHEAVAVDPESGVVYLTEDQYDGLLYRFVPDVPGELLRGGRLQALRFRGAPSLDTRNWHDLTRIPVGKSFEVDWVDLDDVESPGNDLRKRGFLAGAARFARGEGIWHGGDSVYFACTVGGRRRIGQIWLYTPSPFEGARGEIRRRGRLELFLEPEDRDVLENCDNLTVAPWGHLVVCEDAVGRDRVMGVTQEGRTYEIARNAVSSSELAGATFSPDGTTLFVNIQENGLTLAISGPWERAKGV